MLLFRQNSTMSHTTGKTELLDEREFVVDLSVRTRHPLVIARAIPPARTLLGDLAQPRHLAVTGRAREGWQVGSHQREVERAGLAEFGRPFDDAGIASETSCLLGARSQVCSARRRQPSVDLVERAASAHCGHRRSQLAP